MTRLSEDGSWFNQPNCPHLPMVTRRLTAGWTRVHRGRRDGGFYQASLEYAQSLWMEGKPAQAILQLNKAWSAELMGDEEVLRTWPLPYRALLWILLNAPEEGFLGNPVRHFQHLATRMCGRNAGLRSWRAWACYHLSAGVLPALDFPADFQQIEREGIVVPEMVGVLDALDQQGFTGEVDLLQGLMTEMKARE